MLRTPSVTDSTGGAISEVQARDRGRMVKTADQAAQLAFENGLKVSDSITSSLLSTPTTMDAKATNAPDVAQKFLDDGRQTCLSYEIALMPTPNTMEHREIKTPEQIAALKAKSPGGYANLRETVVNDLMLTPKALDGIKGNLKTSEQRKASGHFVDLTNVANDLALLGTPRTSSANGHSQVQVDADAPKARIEDQVLTTSWGKFEPAIRRWEAVLGRPAPAPTKPDGKDGAHRLSSKFTEWMMGLPDGWVTDCGLSRNEELKACGNGVVPQQAELALRIMLHGLELPVGGGQVNLPTPMVSDIYSDSMKSSQQKEGSMHSVTLAQAVKMV